MTAQMWLQDWDPWMVGCDACPWTHAIEPVNSRTQAAAETAFRAHAKEVHGMKRAKYQRVAD